jgi:hypothetical protein
MPEFQTILASTGPVSLSPADLLRSLRQRLRL